jgi:hypothetical protein
MFRKCERIQRSRDCVTNEKKRIHREIEGTGRNVVSIPDKVKGFLNLPNMSSRAMVMGRLDH